MSKELHSNNISECVRNAKLIKLSLRIKINPDNQVIHKQKLPNLTRNGKLQNRE